MSLFSSKTKSEIEKLVEENDELKNTLHTVLQKHQNLVELDNKLTEARKQFNELQKQTERIKNEIDSKNGIIRELTTSIETLEEKKSLFESQTEEFTAGGFDTRKEEADNLDKHYNDLKFSYEKLLNEYSAVQHNVASLRLEEEKLSGIIEQFGGNVDETVTRVREAESELNERIAQLKAEEAKRSAAIKALDEKITLSEDIKSNLELSLSAIVGQLSEKEKIFAEYSNQKELLAEELRSKQKEYDAFDLRFNFAKENIQKLEDEVRALSEKRNSLSDEIHKYEVVLNEIQEKILLYRNEEENFSESLKQKQNAIEDIEKRKFEVEEAHLVVENNFSQVLLKFTEELNTAKNRLSSLRQDILDKEKELNGKEKILLEKTTQIAEYGGMTKVLQKERAATEQFMRNLKEEFSELNGEVIKLKDESNKQKINLQQLRSETSSLEIKKESLEKEIRQLLNQTSENFSGLNENKQKLSVEVAQSSRELDELKEQISKVRNDLRDLKAETANVETQKEEFTAKISELIAMEKNLKYKISEHEKKINGLEDRK